MFEVFLGPASPPTVIPISEIAFDCSTNTLTIVTRPYGSQAIIPGVLDLGNIGFSLTVTLTDAQSLVVTFGGQWSIGQVTIDVGVVYTRATGQFDITATPSGTRFDLAALASDFTGLTLPNPFGGSISFDSFVLSGVIASDGTTTLIISQTLQVTKVYLIYHKPSGGTSQKAIAAEFANFNFASLISQATGVDVSAVPYFGSLTAPAIGLTISTAAITGLPADTFAASSLLSLNGDSVENGITAYLNFDFLPEPLKMTFNGKLSFTPPSTGGLSVSTLISVIPNLDLNSIPVPFDFNIITNVDIVSFSLSNDVNNAASINVQYPNGLSFFDDLITVMNADITLFLSRQPTKLRVQLSGDLSIGSSSFMVSLFTDNNDNYVIQASANTLPITSAISQFGASVLPPELNSLLGGIPFFSFTIDSPHITYPFSSVPKQIQLGGTPIIAGYSTVSMDAIIIRQASKTDLVMGFDIGSVNLADILHTISGFSFNSIPILNQDLEATIVISPVTLPNLRLTGSRLSTISITQGVSLDAQMSFPSGCSSDLFCAVAQFLLGADAKLVLRGTASSATSFSVFAGVSDVTVGSGIVISDAGFEIQAGVKSSVGITGTIILANPPITLTSRIFLSTSGVVLEMAQTGCWDRAFGASWLSVCNVLGSIGMIPGVTVTALAVGGEIRLGDPSCSTPITAIGFLGIDTLTPTNNYYYVQFTDRTTVASVLSSFCLNLNLPRPLAESGFPHGFLSSFSLTGTTIDNAGISIPQGYRLNGTLNILGLEGSADVTIGLPDGINIAVALPPINVGNGLLQMTASSSDTSRGPFLRAVVVILPSPSVDISASGYLNVLGISVEASLRITNTNYELSFSGNMLNLFQANLFISASYGSLSQASFQVRGSFRNDLFDRIQTEIQNTLQNSANEASAAIGSAQNAVNSQRGKFDDANRVLESGKRDVASANSAFNSAVSSLNSAQNTVNGLCSLSNCGSSESISSCYRSVLLRW